MNPRTVASLLDRDTAADYLGELSPSRPVRSLTLDSVWAKPGRYFNVCYRVDDGTTQRLSSLCMVDANEAARALRRVAQLPVFSPLSPDVLPDDLPARMVADDVLAQSFPFDYRLPLLAECARPAAACAVLGDGTVDSCEVAAYRPGMRCQLRYKQGGAARAYGKTAVERDPGRRRRVHRDLSAATATCAMRVPELLGSVDSLGLDLVAAVHGTSLHDELATSPTVSLVTSAVQALAEVHAAVEPPRDRVHTVADELALARTWVEWMADVEPDLGSRLRSILASLFADAPETSPHGFAHRDFYDKQILVDGERLWLLDVDTACVGDRELDLGNFLSQLFLRGLQWDRSVDHRGLEEAAAEAYGPTARAAVARWYRRTSLLRLACVYQLRPHWRHVVPALLDEAALP